MASRATQSYFKSYCNHENLHVSGLNIPLRCSEIFTSKFNEKLDFVEVEKVNLSNEVRKFKQIDTFLDHLNQKNICLFLPNESFITVFHTLLESLRMQEFQKLTTQIRNKQIDFSGNAIWKNDLVKKFASNIKVDEDELDSRQIIELYSNLAEVLVPGMVRRDEHDLRDDIAFVSNELEDIALYVMDNIFSTS
jgi:hypothetical protein